jgi:2-C-methyl-D-erythritol 2,4-cyclodiphosphate synthase
MNDIRVGHGFDVHAFAENRKLIVGGVDIPHELGLAGHSDADVLLHAICDALLGAAGLGDIGRHFPDTDAAFPASTAASCCAASPNSCANAAGRSATSTPRSSRRRRKWRRTSRG